MFHLQEAGINSGYLSGSVSWDEQRALMDGLRQTPPGVQVLFVTPEKVAASDNLMRVLDSVYANGALVSVKHGQRLPLLHLQPAALAVACSRSSNAGLSGMLDGRRKWGRVICTHAFC